MLTSLSRVEDFYACRGLPAVIHVAPAEEHAALDALLAERGGRVASVGLAVAAPGWAGVFSMATSPAHRRQGLAAAILRTAARWASDQGAGHLYLQVEAGNHPARRLYDRLGFRLSHTYHFRRRAGRTADLFS